MNTLASFDNGTGVANSAVGARDASKEPKIACISSTEAFGWETTELLLWLGKRRTRFCHGAGWVDLGAQTIGEVKNVQLSEDTPIVESELSDLFEWRDDAI